MKEVRCPEHATCNMCKSSNGKLLFKVVSKEQVPTGVVVEIVCPQLRGKLIRVEV